MVVVAASLVVAGVAVNASATSPSATSATTVTSRGPINLAAIPLGDGHVSTTPKLGSVDSCVTSFGHGGGASSVGPWINSAKKTWDSKTKVHVHGAVSWPNARYVVSVSGATRVISGNDLPVDHTTGVFPIARSDPAYTYDQNPNHIAPHTILWHLPAQPTKAPHASCLPLGPIGILNDGVVLFNALDANGHDAVAHELQDACDEHPAPGNILHHHDVPSCILSDAKGSSTLVGYALDGYGIYVERNSKGQVLTNTSLDACHGRVSTVLWNGKRQRLFHYDATLEYPYTVGCFEGTPIKGTLG